MDELVFAMIGLIISILVILGLYSEYRVRQKRKTWIIVVTKKLSELKKNIEIENESSQKLSLIEIDKLLDFVMKKNQIKGETMGERLKNAKNWFSPRLYNDLWEAHKARNILVHEVSITLPSPTIKKHFKTLSMAIAKLSQ